MSDAIYVRVKLKSEFGDITTSDFLFNIIKEGCNRRIAMTVVDPDLIVRKRNECILSLTDSFNRELANPLIGKDYDGEVEEYRPEPLHTRLLNLQELFRFILKEKIAREIEVYFTLDYDVEELETIRMPIEDFALMFEPMILNNRWCGLSYRVVWKS